MAKIGYLWLMIVLSVKILELHAACITRDYLLEKLHKMNRSYSKYPPVNNEDAQNEVSVQLEIVDLTAISELNMEYTTTMIVRMKWMDERLGFSEPTNCRCLVLTEDMVKLVWRPNLFISSERKAVAQTFQKYEESAYVYPTGEVRLSMRISMTTFCKMELRHYPFDVQLCEIRIESYAFTTDIMVLKWYDYVAQHPSIEFPNFDINVSNHSNGTYSNEDGSLINGTFSYLNVTLKLTRKSSAYGTMYFAPYPVFFIIALSSFAFKDQIGSRIILCTTGMTTSVLQWIGIFTRLSPVSYLTYLDGWILAHVCLIGLILVYHALWYMCLHQAHKEQHEFEEMLRESLPTIVQSKMDADKSKKFKELLSIVQLNEDAEESKEIDDEPFVKKKPSLKYFLNNITYESVKKLTSDKRYTIICKRKREEYFESYLDRLGRNRIMKAIQKNSLDISVFLMFIVVYSMLPVVFEFWAAEDDISKMYLWFLLIELIPVGWFIALIVSHLCRCRNSSNDCGWLRRRGYEKMSNTNQEKTSAEDQPQSESPDTDSNEETQQHNQDPQQQSNTSVVSIIDIPQSHEQDHQQQSNAPHSVTVDMPESSEPEPPGAYDNNAFESRASSSEGPQNSSQHRS